MRATKTDVGFDLLRDESNDKNVISKLTKSLATRANVFFRGHVTRI